MNANVDNTFWRGFHLNTIYNGDKWNSTYWPPVTPADNHTVLYHLPLVPNGTPPKPHIGNLNWDASHVRLPCSYQSQYPVKNEDGSITLEKRWELVEAALLRPILTSRELAKAILSYNTKYERLWKFHSLHRLFEEKLEEEESSSFFNNTLPAIINLALQLPNLIQTAIPLLKQEENRSISLSQQQIGCLLANAFLCTFPRRNTKKKNSEYFSFPDINFNRLFQGTEQKCMEKLRCLCNYFQRICTSVPTGVVTFTRRCISEKNFPSWNECSKELSTCKVHVSSKGTIEESGLGMLQVDFANRFIGGGVLGGGSVQEEIRFVICPELIVSRLFTESMKSTEALFIIGCEQFNKYNGYASTFTWNGDYHDETPLDNCRRRKCHIVAIDALRFSHTDHQFKEELMIRELKKAFVGYYYNPRTPTYAVATGNWGCGAYKGDVHLKFLIQLMVCCTVYRPLVYFTFDDQELQNSIYEMYEFLCTQNVTVAEIWKYMREFREKRLAPKKLYPFIYNKFKTNKEREIQNEDVTINKTTKPKDEQKHTTEIDYNTTIIKSKFDSIKTILDKKNDKSTNHLTTNPTKIKDNENIEIQNKLAGPSKSRLLSCLDDDYNINKINKSQIIENSDVKKNNVLKSEPMEQDYVLINVPEFENNDFEQLEEKRIDDNLNVKKSELDDKILNDDSSDDYDYVPSTPPISSTTSKIAKKSKSTLPHEVSSSSFKRSPHRQRKIFDFFK